MADHLQFRQPLPGQPGHQRLELLRGQLQGRCSTGAAGVRPLEAAAVQPPRGTPHSEAIRVRDPDEALAIANDTGFGLSSGVCTTSLKMAAHFKARLQAGMVMVNAPIVGVDPHVPFGGRKGSSYGSREQGRHAAEFYTTVKTAYVNP